MLIGISGKIGSGKDTVAKMLMKAVIEDSDDIRCRTADTSVLALEGLQFLSGYTVRRFAGILKEMTALLTGCKAADLEDPEFKNRELGIEWDRSLADAKEFLVLKGLTSRYNLEDLQPEVVEDWAIRAGFKFTRTYRELLQELGTNVMRQHLHPNVWVNALFSTYDPQFAHWIIPDVRFPNEAEAIKERDGILIRVERKTEPVPERYTKAANVAKEHSSETALDNYREWDVVIENAGSLEELQDKVTDLVKQFNLQQHHGKTKVRTKTASLDDNS